MPNLSALEVASLRKQLEDMFSREETRMRGLRGQAGEARGAYEDLAAAPAPEVSGIESGLQQLFGDMGSIISRRPELGERSREDIKQRGAILRQQRIQNIQILRDKYQVLAQRAEKFDPIEALKYTEKSVRMGKLLDQDHEKEVLTTKGTQATGLQTQADEAAMARTRVQTAGELDVANVNADTRLLKALALGRGATTDKEYDDLLGNLDKLYVEKGKATTKDARTFYQYKGQLLSIKPSPDITLEQWKQKMITKLTGQKGGKLGDGALGEIIIAGAMHYAPTKATPTKKAAAVAGTTPITEVSATRPPQDVIIESPTGQLRGRAELAANELQNLVRIIARPARGPSEQVIHQRARKRISQLIRIIEDSGARVTFPPPEVAGVETQAYSDQFLDEEAR